MKCADMNLYGIDLIFFFERCLKISAFGNRVVTVVVFERSF